jgi:hypothetical protein
MRHRLAHRSSRLSVSSLLRIGTAEDGPSSKERKARVSPRPPHLKINRLVRSDNFPDLESKPQFNGATRVRAYLSNVEVVILAPGATSDVFKA